MKRLSVITICFTLMMPFGLPAQTDDLRVVVPPLLTSKWGGGSPYNGLCPIGKDGKKTAIGCAAVSAPQVMHYWKWPERGWGQHTYTCILDGNPETTVELSADFGNTAYEWDKMLDTYMGDNATDEEKLAAATICYHFGVAVDMDFGVNNSPNRGYSIDAFLRHFRFYAKRLYGRTREEYAEVMRRELEAGRPVLFHGTNEDASRMHTFVCDGYAEDDYFHFNFGLRGSLDGYYKLEDLVTTDGRDYRFNQRIIYDIRPYKGEMPTGPVELTVEKPGTLQAIIDESAAPFATSLKVSGPLNGADILALRKLAGRDDRNISTFGILTDLDLTDVTFVPSEDIYWQRETDGLLQTWNITDASVVPYNSFCYTNLHRVVLPTSVTALDTCAFYACSNLTEVEFGINITRIGASSLRATGLTELDLPEQITTIEPWALGDNSNLKKIRISKNVTSIGYSAFNRNLELEEVVSDITQPFYIPNNVFSETTFANTTLRVPAGTARLYRRSANWRLFANVEEQEGEPFPLPFMVMASWNQGSPFNGDCPEYEGTKCAAGCATIAMAQILHYYERPAKGFGHATYHSAFQGTSFDLEADFDSHPFDWVNIRDAYTVASSEAERKAVANLIYMTASAMKMQFSPKGSSTTNFGAWMWGLQHHLHLAPTSRWLNRRYYSTAEWTEMINAQLDAGHPVLYNGAHTDPFGVISGHYFNIDGRDAQGNYHFNFGHDSNQQDKFSNLNACNQGALPKPGNIYACYHYRQAMITDCYPVDGLTDADYPRCEAALSMPFVLENKEDAREVSVSGRVRAKFQYRCISYDADVIQYSLGFYLNGQLADVSPSWRQNSIVIGGGISNVDRYFQLPTLPDGEYEMALVTRTDEDAPWLRGWDNVPNRVPVTVSGTAFTFHIPNNHNGKTHLRLIGDIQEIPDARKGGRTFEFTIENPSDQNFEDTLSLYVVTPEAVTEARMPTAIYDGQTVTYCFFISDSNADFSGDFSLELFYPNFRSTLV